MNNLTSSATYTPLLKVEPEVALIDVERHITISGFPPFCPIQLTVNSHWEDGSAWSSVATFFSDIHGAVDLAVDAPMRGSYNFCSSMGPIWSMTRTKEGSASFPPEFTAPITNNLLATGGGFRASARLVQTFIAPGVTSRTIMSDGVAGELFIPSGPGPHPVVIYMNGSSGGINAPRAALFAAHGFASLALGIFRTPGRPDFISETPLEYIQNAINWVRQNLQPSHGFVALSGISRGGELSLLVAAAFPDLVSAVIAYVPSAVAHGTLSAGREGEGRNADAWTLEGKAVPHLWQNNFASTCWDRIFDTSSAVRQADAYIEAMADQAAFESALISVDKIKSPVLLISGTDDGFWPSTTYCDIVKKALNAANPSLPVAHCECSEAGHHILYPYLPSTIIEKRHAMSGVTLTGGGTPGANARANEQSYRQVLSFLNEALIWHRKNIA